MTIKRIKHVMQIDNQTCASACLAMLTGRDINRVVDEFDADYHNKAVRGPDHNPFKYLSEAGLKVHVSSPLDMALYYGRVYCLSVPSINFFAKNHLIVADMVEPTKETVGQEDGGCYVLDPNDGREGVKVYDYWKLNGWSVICWMFKSDVPEHVIEEVEQ